MEIVHNMKACTYLHETRNIEVIMAENVPKLMAYTKEHTREAQRTPSRINTKKKKISSQAQHIQSIESQRQKKQRKNLERIQRTNIFSLQKPKYLLFL